MNNGCRRRKDNHVIRVQCTYCCWRAKRWKCCREGWKGIKIEEVIRGGESKIKEFNAPLILSRSFRSWGGKIEAIPEGEEELGGLDERDVSVKVEEDVEKVK